MPKIFQPTKLLWETINDTLNSRINIGNFKLRTKEVKVNSIQNSFALFNNRSLIETREQLKKGLSDDASIIFFSDLTSQRSFKK